MKYAAVPVGSDAGKEPRYGFFVSSGIRPGDAKILRKICIRVSLATKTGLEYLMNLPVLDLLDLVKELGELGKQKRIRNGN